MSIKENLKKIKEQIGNHNVKIIAVSKYATYEQTTEAYRLGIRDFGESYVQDAIPKLKKLITHNDETSEKKIRWHFIGRLQNNKVKFVVNIFYLIHSVHSIELLNLINKSASSKGIVQNLLLQVNISQEASKAGFSPSRLKQDFEKMMTLSNVNIQGLMTIAPKIDDKNKIRSCFTELYNLQEELNKNHLTNLKELSMGMTNDYVEAIECGSTMIRIGKGIFNIKGG